MANFDLYKHIFALFVSRKINTSWFFAQWFTLEFTYYFLTKSQDLAKNSAWKIRRFFPAPDFIQWRIAASDFKVWLTKNGDDHIVLHDFHRTVEYIVDIV